MRKIELNKLRPRLVMSACLAGENVRYDGQPVSDDFSLKLLAFCEVIKVCPEVAIGLGVPRDRVILYYEGRKPRLFQPATGRELTQELVRFSRHFLENLKEVDGFLLKAKSPSCGVSRTKTYRDREGTVYKGLGKGLFAQEALKKFPMLYIEDELRLKDPRRKLRFLIGIFSSALLRQQKSPQKLHQLIGEYIAPVAPMIEKRMQDADVQEYLSLLRRATAKLSTKGLKSVSRKLVPEELIS